MRYLNGCGSYILNRKLYKRNSKGALDPFTDNIKHTEPRYFKLYKSIIWNPPILTNSKCFSKNLIKHHVYLMQIIKMKNVCWKLFLIFIEYLIRVVFAQNIYIVESVWRITNTITNTANPLLKVFCIITSSTTIYLLPQQLWKIHCTWCKNKNDGIMVCALLT